MLNIKYYETISSTNDVLKEMAKNGAEESTSLVAFCQTNGKGRRGKNFSSPKNGLYMSLLVRPNLPFDKVLYLTTATAVGVTEIIKEKYNINLGIKWVNDLYKGEKKVCGILVESSPIKNSIIEWAVIGIGINVTRPKNGFDNEIKDIATSLYDTNESKSETELKDLSKSLLENVYEVIKKGNEDSVYEKYCKNNICINRNVKVLSAEPYNALATKINRDYHLIVKDENNELHELSSGEISIKL